MLEGKTPRFVTAAEITRNFGMWQDRAAQAPLIVTHHGRPRVVMIAAEDYELLARAPEGDAVSNQDGTALGVLTEHIEAASPFSTRSSASCGSTAMPSSTSIVPPRR